MKPSLESILHEAVNFEAEALDHALENGGIQITSGDLIVMVFKRSLQEKPSCKHR